MNNIVFRDPDQIYVGYDSEHDLGGFCVQSGKAWRYLIPLELQGSAYINLPGFLVQTVSISLDIKLGDVKPHDCLLAVGKSTTAAGWCKMKNFREECEDEMEWKVKHNIVRMLAKLVLERDTVLYT